MYDLGKLQPYGIFVKGEIPSVFPPWGDRKQWMVDHAFEYICKRGYVVRVEDDFATDLASIPRWLRVFFGANGREAVAAIIHDNLYREQGKKRFNVLTKSSDRLNRQQCDEILYDVMKLAGTGRIRRWFIYRGVRLGGWVAWKKNRKER